MQRSSAPGRRGRQRRGDRYRKNCGQENTSYLLHRYTPKIFLLDSAGGEAVFIPALRPGSTLIPANRSCRTSQRSQERLRADALCCTPPAKKPGVHLTLLSSKRSCSAVPERNTGLSG